MKLAFRILAVIASSAFAGATVFLVHLWRRIDFDLPGVIDAYTYAFFAAAIASLFLMPLLLLVQRLAPAGARGALVMGASLVGSALLATLALTQWLQFTLDLPDLVRKAWFVYLYFMASGLTFGALWILLVMDAVHAMRYLATCPSCATKISRWLLFSELKIVARCRGCGAGMSVSFGGWVAGFVGIALAVGCFLLFLGGVLSRPIVVALILVQMGSGIWLSPYILPVQLAKEKKRSQDDAA
jgi:hypothetical protein